MVPGFTKSIRNHVQGSCLWVWFLLASGCLVSCQSNSDLGESCLKIGDLQRAEHFFDAELDKNPGSFRARYGLALTLQEQARTKKNAEEDSIADWLRVIHAFEIARALGESVTLKENLATCHFHLADYYFQRDQLSESLEELDQAQELDPENKFVLNLLGIVQWKLGWVPEAKRSLEFLLSRDSSFVPGYLNLGNVLWDAGDQTKALDLWSKALELEPGNASLLRRINKALKSDK